MDASVALESIAQLLPGLPSESVEDLLVSFDSLVGVSDAAVRPRAAAMLREKASMAGDQSRRERLLVAADAVEAGRSCAVTPEGLSAIEAAAAQSVTKEQWEARIAANPLPPLPSETDGTDEDDEDDDVIEDEGVLEAPPPALPQLKVENFFPGVVVRVARDFADSQQRNSRAGDVLKLLKMESLEGGKGTMLAFVDRTLRIERSHTNYAAILENARNEWFQPVPSIECLEDLQEAIGERLDVVDEEEDLQDDDLDRLEAIREDLEECEEWLAVAGGGEPPPECTSLPDAEKQFGKNDGLTALLRLLYAGVKVCPVDED